MKILARLLALFLIMPVVELALLVQVDKLIGFWPTIGIILFTGILGSYLAKREGLAVWQRFNQRMNTGELPGTELLDGVIILIAGALLITPGVVTDFVGFTGLFPPTRRLIRKIAMRYVNRAMRRGNLQMSFGAFGGGEMDFSEPSGRQESYWQGEPHETPHHEQTGAPDDQERGEPRPGLQGPTR